ncbi:VWA domain-containing protein [Blastococcus sp. URHD0036]|uniref:vWA domain-containing protein n=1 Tax=Blastococcus sp. URHD0036 TaxID=1380356 RepID=UPI00068C8F95|nr:VWA domain-containing protein [Blastococcus sp. URHD0036]
MVAAAAPGGLAGHLDGFVRAVREAGIPVGISQAVDAAEILTVVELLDREQLRHGLAAVLLQRGNQRQIYDTLFDLWWPLGDRPQFVEVTDEDDDGDGEAMTLEAPEGDLDPAARMREELARLLAEGDEEELARFARRAVGLLGQTSPSPSGQSWFSYRVMRALSPDTLTSQLLEGLLNGEAHGGLAEQVARGEVRERLRSFKDAVDTEVRRRQADERGRERIAKSAVKPLADQIDFLRAQQGDLAELRRMVAPLARRLAVRLSARRRHGREGRLDFRKTVRASLATGGVPVVTHHRPRKIHKPELVVLCDISGSVAGFSHFTLMLTQALREHFSGVRAFAFVDSTDEVTRFFSPGADVADAIRRIGREADVVAYEGHSDYGNALEVFADRWPTVVGPKTSLMVLGDGRTNYRPPGLPVLADLVRRSRSAHWLNPEPRRVWGSGDSAALKYAEVVDMVECRNAAQLADFVTTL